MYFSVCDIFIFLVLFIVFMLLLIGNSIYDLYLT